jgi:hypothetical protein
MTSRGRRVVGPGLLVGLWITTLGVIFLLDQQGIVPAHVSFHFVWPGVLIALGLGGVFSTNSGHRFWGALLLTLGALSLSNDIGFLHVRIARLWPLFLIGLGLWMLFNSSGKFGPGPGSWPGPWGPHGHFRDRIPGAPDSGSPTAGPPPPPPPGGPPSATQASWVPGGSPSATQASFVPGPAGESARATGATAGASAATNYPASDEPEFDQAVVFSGFKRRVTSRHFRYGKIAAVFGGFNIDFNRAEIDGEYAVLNIDAVFGGGEVRVPDHWRIVIEGSAIAGAFVDETYGSPDPGKPIKRLIIRGTAVCGGVSFKS